MNIQYMIYLVCHELKDINTIFFAISPLLHLFLTIKHLICNCPFVHLQLVSASLLLDMVILLSLDFFTIIKAYKNKSI